MYVPTRNLQWDKKNCWKNDKKIQKENWEEFGQEINTFGINEK